LEALSHTPNTVSRVRLNSTEIRDLFAGWLGTFPGGGFARPQDSRRTSLP
jgi:hypothetical protein